MANDDRLAEDIEKVPAERLLAFYKKYYQPDNAALTIAGKIDDAKTLQGGGHDWRIPRPTRHPDQTYTVGPRRMACATWNRGASAKGRN